jgi:hypothetical protein
MSFFQKLTRLINKLEHLLLEKINAHTLVSIICVLHSNGRLALKYKTRTVFVKHSSLLFKPQVGVFVTSIH